MNTARNTRTVLMLLPLLLALAALAGCAAKPQVSGDTETGATTNISDIGGTPGGAEAFLITNGFRKSPLMGVFPTAFSWSNRRKAGTESDFKTRQSAFLSDINFK